MLLDAVASEKWTGDGGGAGSEVGGEVGVDVGALGDEELQPKAASIPQKTTRVSKRKIRRSKGIRKIYRIVTGATRVAGLEHARS